MKNPLYWKTGLLGAVLLALAAPDLANAQNLPSVSILATDPTALEGTSSGAFTVILDSPATNDLAVYLDISGSATNGYDYETITNPVIIPSGSMAVDIPIVPLVVNRGNTFVTISIQANAGYSVKGHWRRHPSAKVEIVDDTYNVPPPTVSLESPTNDTEFASTNAIELTANANDTEFPITKVSFYADDFFLGCVTNSPYSLTWSNAPPGHYSLFARAVDQVGQSVLSAPIRITVTGSHRRHHRD